jgi:hypothetical protein
LPLFDSRRAILGAAKKLLDTDEAAPAPHDAAPRLTPAVLAPAAAPPPASPASARMSRSRDKILENLDEMYREAFERARATGDAAQMASLDFAYRREQLYFEILLDVRDAMERRA